MNEELKKWLKANNLQQYNELFDAQGQEKSDASPALRNRVIGLWNLEQKKKQNRQQLNLPERPKFRIPDPNKPGQDMINPEYKTGPVGGFFLGAFKGAQIGKGEDPFFRLGSVLGAGLAGLFAPDAGEALKYEQALEVYDREMKDATMRTNAEATLAKSNGQIDREIRMGEAQVINQYFREKSLELKEMGENAAANAKRLELAKDVILRVDSLAALEPDSYSRAALLTTNNETYRAALDTVASSMGVSSTDLQNDPLTRGFFVEKSIKYEDFGDKSYGVQQIVGDSGTIYGYRDSSSGKSLSADEIRERFRPEEVDKLAEFNTASEKAFQASDAYRTMLTNSEFGKRLPRTTVDRMVNQVYLKALSDFSGGKKDTSIQSGQVVFNWSGSNFNPKSSATSTPPTGGTGQPTSTGLRANVTEKAISETNEKKIARVNELAIKLSAPDATISPTELSTLVANRDDLQSEEIHSYDVRANRIINDFRVSIDKMNIEDLPFGATYRISGASVPAVSLVTTEKGFYSVNNNQTTIVTRIIPMVENTGPGNKFVPYRNTTSGLRGLNYESFGNLDAARNYALKLLSGLNYSEKDTNFTKDFYDKYKENGVSSLNIPLKHSDGSDSLESVQITFEKFNANGATLIVPSLYRITTLTPNSSLIEGKPATPEEVLKVILKK